MEERLLATRLRLNSWSVQLFLWTTRLLRGSAITDIRLLPTWSWAM